MFVHIAIPKCDAHHLVGDTGRVTSAYAPNDNFHGPYRSALPAQSGHPPHPASHSAAKSTCPVAALHCPTASPALGNLPNAAVRG